MSAIPDIPPGLSQAEFVQAVNDRLRRIVKLIAPAGDTSENLDMMGFRVIRAGNAVNPTDLVNLQTGDERYLQQPSGAASQQGSHTIIMQAMGLIAVGNLVAPACMTTKPPEFQYIIDKAYIGVPSLALAPTGADAIIDPVYLPAGSAANAPYKKILASPLVLPAGKMGPITVDNFVSIPFMTTELDLFNANVLQTGSTFPGSQVFIGLRVRQIN